MRPRLITGILATTLLVTAAAPIGCGYYLHPERRGNSSNVDSGSLIMDLLWLLPGIIPGVIALVVDFSSGAVYTSGGGRSAVVLSPEGHVAVRLPVSAKPAQVEVRLVTDAREVLAKKTASVGPDIKPQSIELQIVDPHAHRNERIYLEVASANGTARFPTSVVIR